MKNQQLDRPGIAKETLNNAQIKHQSKSENEEAVGCKASGLFIPYFDLLNNKVIENDRQYGRLRLDKPVGKKKYHQPKGSVCHAYVPPFFKSKPTEPLILVEGEFKALSLIESGFNAIGIPGFYTVINGAPLPEIIGYIEAYEPEYIYYLGDNDTALNWQFSDAVCKFREVVEVPLLLPRIPLNSDGKGIGDVKESMGPAFKKWFIGILDSAMEVCHEY